jgi:hypothetical protein
VAASLYACTVAGSADYSTEPTDAAPERVRGIHPHILKPAANLGKLGKTTGTSSEASPTRRHARNAAAKYSACHHRDPDSATTARARVTA